MPVPEGEVQEDPKFEAAPRRLGAVEQLAHHRRIEVFEKRLPKELLLSDRAQAGQPAPYRRTEPLLPPSEYEVGHGPGEGALENPLPLAIRPMEWEGKPRGELNELRVEVRRSSFDGRSHRHLVDPHQEELRHPQPELVRQRHRRKLIVCRRGTEAGEEILISRAAAIPVDE